MLTLNSKFKMTADEQIRATALTAAASILQKATVYNFKDEIVIDMAEKYVSFIKEGKKIPTSLIE